MKKNNIILFSVLGVLALTLLGFGIYYTTTQSDNQFFALVKGGVAPAVEKQPDLQEAELITENQHCLERGFPRFLSNLNVALPSPATYNPENFPDLSYDNPDEITRLIDEIMVDEFSTKEFQNNIVLSLLKTLVPEEKLDKLPSKIEDFDKVDITYSYDKTASNEKYSLDPVIKVERLIKIPNAPSLGPNQAFIIIKASNYYKQYFYDYSFEIEYKGNKIASRGKVIVMPNPMFGQLFNYASSTKSASLGNMINIKNKDFIEPAFLYSTNQAGTNRKNEIELVVIPEKISAIIPPAPLFEENFSEELGYDITVPNPIASTTNLSHPNFEKINEITNQVIFEAIVNDLGQEVSLLPARNMNIINIDRINQTITYCAGPVQTDIMPDAEMQELLNDPIRIIDPNLK